MKKVISHGRQAIAITHECWYLITFPFCIRVPYSYTCAIPAMTSNLSFFSSKCKYMLISRKRTPTLPECPLIPTNCKLQMFILTNILVFCCQKICPGHHIYMHAICSKARNILRRFSLQKIITVLILIHSNSCISHRSQMEYACQVWAPHMKWKVSKSLHVKWLYTIGMQTLKIYYHNGVTTMERR